MHILAISDWGRRGSPGQRAVADGMARVARESGTRFVVAAGDNFYDDGVLGPDDPHWQESWERVYTAPELQVPWFAALGNHDHRGDPFAQIARTARDTRWRMPAPCHAVTWTGADGVSALFAFLDTTPFLRRYLPGGAEETPGVDSLPTAAQLRWLDETLRRSTAPWKVVVGHHPIRSGSPFHGGNPELGLALTPLLQRHRVHAYLCGHEHDLQHLEHDGLHFVVSGAAAEARETGHEPATRFCAGQLGFVGLGLHRERLAIRFHDAAGDVLHEHELRAGQERRVPVGRS